MALETELKLALAASDTPLLLAHPLLAAVPRRLRLYNTYFDTPALDLLSQRIAVRERQDGHQTLLTVKTGGSVTGALAQRGEWEAPTTPGHFDFAALVANAPSLADDLQALAANLVPVFHTDFSRRIWLLAHRGALIEVALDRGRIHATPAGATRAVTQPLLELELELKDGPVDALFSLARKLARAVVLRPVTDSKAQRGYALFRHHATAPAKATPLDLQGDSSPIAAFVAIAQSGLAQLQANEAGMLHSDDPEYLHQARVAVRRLRAALRLFAPTLSPRFVRRWSRHWRTLGRVLGQTRDADVFSGSTLPELTATLPRRDAARLQRWARAHADDARAEVRRYLQGHRYPARLLAFARELQRLSAPSTTSLSTTAASKPRPSRHRLAKAKAGTTNLKRWARQQLRSQAKSLRRHIRSADLHDDAARHRVRIEARKLRYSLTFFSNLWPAPRIRPYANILAGVQELLGQMNDRVTARALLDAAVSDQLAPVAASVTLLRERLAAQLAHDAQRLPSVLAALSDAPALWRKRTDRSQQRAAPRKKKK